MSLYLNHNTLYLEKEIMTTYSKPHKAMTIRSGSGKSQNIDNLKYLNTEETDPEPKNRGFFRKYL